MKVQKLIDLLTAYCEMNPSNADREINIMITPTNNQRIGINNGVGIDSVITGFDWNHNHMFIVPEKNLTEFVKPVNN